jgi:hypothetical protein
MELIQKNNCVLARVKRLTAPAMAATATQARDLSYRQVNNGVLPMNVGVVAFDGVLVVLVVMLLGWRSRPPLGTPGGPRPTRRTCTDSSSFGTYIKL